MTTSNKESSKTKVHKEIELLLKELIDKKWGVVKIEIKAQGGKLTYFKGGVTHGLRLTNQKD
jgi:hypothetical protein